MNFPSEYGGVTVEVELVFFTFRRRHGLTLSCYKGSVPDSARILPRTFLVPRELPAAAVGRLLAEIHARTSLHPPAFAGAFVHDDRQVDHPTLSLTYVVIGSTPSDSAEGIVPVTFGSSEEQIGHQDAVDAARLVAIDLMSQLPIGPVLAPKRGESFTLSELMAVHSAFLGSGVVIDRSNFRRRVESIPGYVERVEPPEWFTPDIHRRGRPESWYVPGGATELDPPLRFS